MDLQEIRFKFDVEMVDANCLAYIFKKTEHWLNIRLDETLKPYIYNENENIYEFMDASHLSANQIETIYNSFFDFTFDNIVNVSLYKFLVLKKDDNKLTVLAIIHSSIFDYTSIKKFTELFNNPKNNIYENNILNHCNYVNNYLKSANFKTDSIYWKNHFLNAENYNKYYNIKSDDYKNIRIPINNELISDFLDDYDFCEFEFITAVFALYLTRIDRTKGTILKTIIPQDTKHSALFDMHTLLKIPYIQDCSFVDYLNEIETIYNDSVEYTKVDIDNYIGDVFSYYEVYDFTKLDNVNIFNGKGSAFTLNIYGDYLDLSYNAELFSDVYMKHMADNINHLINNLITSPNQIVNEIDILSDIEKDLLSDFCKGIRVDVDKNKTLATAFRENAIKYPDFIAVDDGINQVTYAELEKSSNSVAYDLKYNYGVDLGECVGLMVPRNYHFPELACALNKIGAVFTPIDPIYPLKRIEHMLNISEARYIITTKEYADNFSFDVDVIYIEDLNLDYNVSVECLGDGDDLLAIFFTSGTTGLPKAVMVSNKEINGCAVAFKNIFNSKPRDVVGSFVSFSFIASIRLLVSLIFGECCRIFNEVEQKDSLLLVKALKEQEMCDLILPPSIGVPIFENEDIKLKYLILAGAKLNELTNTKSNTRLVNFYGTTELIFAIANIYDLNNIVDDSVPIGKPVANTWVYILDDNGMQMPIGVPGEICISNDFLSPGYYNQPDLTNSVFVDNPYCSCDENRRIYHTGDIGFYNFNGEIEILGREDDQLSVRGFRIESNEVLNIMKSFDDIKDIYLDVDNDILTAYYTARDDLDICAVKDSLNSELPYYMIPSLFVKLDKIPLNANGKIDKHALKIVNAESDVNVGDETLNIVLNAFKDVLSNDSVLLDDNLVEFGGTSLSAMNLQRILKDELGVSLSSSEIIDLASPANIANHIKYNLSAYSSLDINYTFEDKCPLSESQLNVYLDEKVKDMGTAYNNPFKIQFKKKYSFYDVENAVNKLWKSYPVLSARIMEDKGSVSFNFDAEPVISCGLSSDIDNFVKDFDLNKSLVRFLFVEDESLLCMDFHHLIFDGTSLNIILDSLLDNLNDDTVDFVDDGFLRQISMEENMDSDYMENASDFFEEMLEDLDETYDLLDCVKLVDNNDDNREYFDTFDVDSVLLDSFLKESGVTYNQFFCGVFAYTLSRFTCSSKVSFNLVEDGRGHVDLSESVGMFVRTLPLLVDCRNQAIDSFIKYCGGLVNRVMFYDLYPFRLLARDYDLNSNILFQYSHDLFSKALNNDFYRTDELEHDVVGDLSFFIFNADNDKFGIRILYSNKYSSDFVSRFARSYNLILKEMIIENNLCDIDYVSDSDILLLDKINETEHDLLYNDVLDAFNTNLAKYPDNILVSYNNQKYSYGESAFIADRIAKELVSLDVEIDDYVAFLVPRSELYMFSILGILSIGGVYVPLDDNLPDERIKFMLNDTGSDVVIVSDETYNRVSNLDSDCTILNISNIVNDDRDTLSSLPTVVGDLACILYTSGTTGVPKGVKITRKSILNLVENYVDQYGLDSGDVYGLFSSIAFDAASQAIAQSIYAGACLSIIPEDIKYNMNKLNEYFIKENITHTFITTPVGRLFMENIDKTSLKCLSVGGENLGNIKSSNEYNIIDAYGPTETFAFISSINNIDKIDNHSVGFLNYNTKAYLLDNEFRKVPIGAVGELYLSGYQIAQGYINRKEETINSFINNPFDEDEYDVLYRTGDMLRILPDGSLGFVGRRDSQVKIRGNRVELGEVESTIRSMDDIEDVTVQTIKNNGNNELVAYVVSSNDLTNDELSDWVQDYVSEHKPDYMIPSFVISLDFIPLTVNSKIDRRALPDVDLDDLRVEYVAPANNVERDIVNAFEVVFNHRNIGVYDDFVRLGGDSLTAIKLLSHIKEYNVSVGDVLSLRTPHSIAKKIDNFMFDDSLFSLDSGCPLTEPQLNVYLDILANEKRDSYLIPLVMDISNEYGVRSVRDALDEILCVHPVLGMCVSDDYDVPYLIKGSQPEIIVKSDASEGFIKNFLTKHFDLYDSLSRFLIVENNDVCILFAVFHHIIFDAISNKIFKQDLQSILAGNNLNVDDSFLSVAAFNQQIQNDDFFVEAEKFYESMLVDVDDAGVLLDSVLCDGPGSIQFNLDLDNLLFNKFIVDCGVSENVVFTSAFAYALSRFTGNDKALFNIVENGRDRFNNYDSIGMFVNTLPLLVDCHNQDVYSFVDDVGALFYSVLRYNYYPFRLIANKYDIDANIIFQYIPEWIKDNENVVDLSASESDFISEMDDLIGDLSVDVVQSGNDYILSISYSDKYSSDFVNRFARSYNLILKEMIIKNNLCDINYVSDDDVLLLDKINKTEHDLLYNDILDAFNENLSEYPNSMLVSSNNIRYSYSEGAFIADRITEKLVGLGVSAGDCVAFLVPRSELYMFSILGILSIGGVYVPLDDALPDERIKFMLNDTQSKVVIVSDETYDRAKYLINDDVILFNISDIINGEIRSLSSLPVVYGDLACILYTSGTTGIPKGVKITRKSVVNLAAVYQDKYEINVEDVYGLFSTIGFDAALLASVVVLYSGACLSIVPDDVRLNTNLLNEYFISQNVSHTLITSQVGKLFMENVDDISLDVLLVGGEKLGEFKSSGDYLLVDAFGPTEFTVFISSIKNSDKIDSSSVGSLNYNTKAYVLDNENRRVPRGAVGELYLAGHQIAKGYLNRPEETDKAFIDNPFNDSPDYDVLYRTGDMVRILPDGNLGLVGRRDSQVKIRGNRVELSEVESTIRNIDDIEDVTVQTIKNNTNNELVAYIVSSNDLTNDELSNWVQDYVSEHKPDYMVPSFVMKIDEIPLNVNGKVDKRALPDVDFNVLRAEYAAPTNKTEKQIVNVFESVFNQKGIGLYDDFVRLGGDSISAIRVSSLLEKNSIHCSARDILNYKKPYLIAQHVNENIETIYYDAMEGSVDLLPIQSYFFNQINLNNYTQEFVLKFNDDCNRDILQKSFDELCNIHDMLRARYKIIDNIIKQEIIPLNSPVCKINEYNINDDFEENMRDIFVKSACSIDIENKLLDVNLVHYDDMDYLLIVIHHLIIDGVSWNILLSDLTNIYYKLLKNEIIDIIKPYPYQMWVDNVKNLVDNISDDEKQHWLSVNALLDDSLIMGPTNVFSVNFDIDFDVDNLLMLSEDEYLALAISRAYKKTYDKDIIFNRESYGRDDSVTNLNRTVGWFTSQYPVPVEVNNGKDDISLMNDVYSLKKAFGSIKHLGLNYQSLIYTTNDIEYKHCPVTFNFLSNEFIFKNELFESVNTSVFKNEGEINIGNGESDSFGVTFNVYRADNSYIINGDYASNTYIGDKFSEFIDNVREELSFIGNYDFDNIVCALSESQLGVYLDEKVHDKSTAYSAFGVFEYTGNKSINDVRDAIGLLVDKHPILKGRVLDTGDLPLLICDSYPAVEIVDTDDYSKLIAPFDLHECLARFFIIDSSDKIVVGYDMHHMISDATSRSIIERDLNMALDGELDEGTDLGFVYACRDSFESQFRMEYENAHDFFNEMFADIDDVPSLLSDVDACVGSVSLPIRGVREELVSFVQSIGITVSSFLNAVFAYTYSRFTGGNKVYYTFTEHGRHDFYSQDSVGMFVRTIPILIDCSNRTVRDYLADASDLILEAMSNSFYPFRILARDFDLSNDMAFEYNYDLNDVSGIPDEGVVFSDEADRVSELLCVVNDLDDGFVVSLSHLDKISQDTAERFVKVFREVLVQFLDNKCLGDIDYISDDDVLLLDKINETEHDLLYNDILDAFNTNLAKYPDNILVSYNNQKYSYGESAFIADRIAKELVSLDVEIDDYVAFLVPRSELYMFSILGILSIGGVYVPLDDNLPDERIKFMIEDTMSKILIVSDETYERGCNLAKDCTILNISEIINGEIKSLNNLDVSYGDLACILYTSGSTGLPKGVKITRKSILNFIDFHVNDLDIIRGDVYGLFASIGFDVAMAAIFSAMYAGGYVNIIPEDIRLNIKALNNHFVKYGVTHSYITTQVAKLFIQNIESTSLKVLIAGGEKLGEMNETRHYKIVDAYGPTEACVYVISAATVDKIDSSSVGYVQNNTKAYILDDELRRVPIGAIGELYLSGCQLADGYLNRPKENAKEFMENPFEDDPDYGRLYRTGDMARLLPDKTYAIVGRRDSQVKIRGNRVELSEVESAIRSMDAVEDVTVQTVKNNDNNELVAYVVSSGDLTNDELSDRVQDHVSERKPDYMVPPFVMKIDEIPLNVNGKVDKRALPDVNRDNLHVEYIAPRNENEKEIVEAFEKAFKLDKISIYDDFIRLGGDSLIAVKLLNYIESDNVTMADILTFRTPEAIAKNMSEFSFDLDIYSLDDGCPLNSAQINVFADVNTNNKVNAYHIPDYIPISKKYGLEKIIDSLDTLLDMHPILSTHLSERYEKNDNNVHNLDLIKDLTKTAEKFGMKKIMKIIRQYGIMDIKGLYKMLKTTIKLFKGEYPYLVKGSKPPISVMSEIDEKILIDFFSESFDLYNYLSKFMIVESEESYYLFYMVHHIIFDATSAGVFKQDFMTLLDGGSIDFDDTFLKSSAFTHQIKNTEKFNETNEFYQPMLSDLEDASILPEDNPLAEGYSSSSYDLEFDKAAFKSFLRNTGISKNILFTSIFSYALSHFVNDNNVMFTIIENGRDRFNEKFIGMTSNVMPVVIDCKDQCINSYLQDVADTVYGVLRHSYYPILLLYPKYDFEVNILFQYVPNWIADDFTEGIVEIDGINFEEIYNHIINQFSDFLTDFFVQIYENRDDYTLFIAHSNRFSDKMVEDFANIYTTILSNIINIDTTSSNLSDTLK